MQIVSSHIKFSLLIIFFSLYINNCFKLSGFNLDHTDNLLNGLDRDCLYSNFFDENKKVFQLIPYCIRFQLNELPMTNNKNYHSWYTFDDLRQANVKTHELYDWLASIDLIESYQNYLEEGNSTSSKSLFFNCTYPWFGSHCEYKFDQPESTFQQQLDNNFQMKAPRFKYVQKISCYIHLPCDRAGDRSQLPDACLDWREICDGKVDCLDGGCDEEQCWQLETNK